MEMRSVLKTRYIDFLLVLINFFYFFLINSIPIITLNAAYLLTENIQNHSSVTASIAIHVLLLPCSRCWEFSNKIFGLSRQWYTLWMDMQHITPKVQFSPTASFLTKTIHSSCIHLLHKKVTPLSATLAPIILLLFSFIIKYNW